MTASVLTELATMVRAGGVLAVPTESSYALCASPFDARAVQRLRALKGSPDRKPILVLISRPEQLARLAASIPPAAGLLMARCWPGPLTMVFPAVPSLPPALTAETGTIGIRWPNYPALTALLDEVGPLTGTSANRSGEPSLMTAREVAEAFGKGVDAVWDPGPAGGHPPSTLVCFEERTVRMLRQGPVTHEQLDAIVTPAGYRLMT